MRLHLSRGIFLCISLFSTMSLAESIICEVKNLANPRSPVRVSIDSKGINSSLRFLTAKVEYRFDGVTQGANFSLRRINREKQTEYQDKDHHKEFSLIVETSQSSGTDIPASLIINDGFATEKKFDGLSCDLSGQFLEPIYLCPVGAAADKTNLNMLFIDAVKNASPDYVEKLIDCGADVNFSDPLGCTPILYTADSTCGQTTVKRTLSSSRHGNEAVRILDLLVNHGAIYESLDPVNGETSLMKFVKQQELDPAQYLIDAGADLNTQDNLGDTALMIGTMTADTLLVQTILDASPDLTIKNKAQMTAYDIALKFGYEDLYELLAAPSIVINIVGHADGTCSPINIELKKNQRTQIILKSTKDKMFRFIFQKFSLDIMAMPGELSKKIFAPNSSGQFPFSCGVHGSKDQTQGIFKVD